MSLFRKTRVKTLIAYMIATMSLNAQVMEVSQNGKNFIKMLESCSLVKYPDNGGYSIGYGHRIKKGEHTKYSRKITQHHAEQIFANDINTMVNPAINRVVKDLKFKPEQHLIDVIGSMIYNCGEGGFKRTEFYYRLKRCRIDSNGKVNHADYMFTLAAIKNARIPSKKTGLHEGVKNRRIKEYEFAKTKKFDIQ